LPKSSTAPNLLRERSAIRFSKVYARIYETTIWSYVDTSKQVGDPEQLKVFANAEAAEAWFAENDPEGIAFEYEVIQMPESSIGNK
jgi:hypothetical protein